MELLLRHGPGRARVSPVLRHLVVCSVGVPVIVLQPQPRLRAREYPRPRAILADMEWNPDLRRAALTDVHHQPLAGKGGVARRHLSGAARKGAAAESLQRPPKFLLRVRVALSARVTASEGEHCSSEDESDGGGKRRRARRDPTEGEQASW